MTREEAICELSVIWERLSHPEDCENGCYSFRDGDYLEAIDMAIEALSAQQTDLISRADAIEAVASADETNGTVKVFSGLKIIDILKALPSADAEWIQYSAKTPKEKQEVYVTVYFTEGDTGRAYGYIDGFGKWHLYSAVEGVLNSGYKVTAWMPLPKPYKGGDTE